MIKRINFLHSRLFRNSLEGKYDKFNELHFAVCYICTFYRVKDVRTINIWQINVAKEDNFIHVILGQYKPIDNFFSFKKAMRAVVNTLNSFFLFSLSFQLKISIIQKIKSDMTNAAHIAFKFFIVSQFYLQRFYFAVS